MLKPNPIIQYKTNGFINFELAAAFGGRPGVRKVAVVGLQSLSRPINGRFLSDVLKGATSTGVEVLAVVAPLVSNIPSVTERIANGVGKDFDKSNVLKVNDGLAGLPKYADEVRDMICRGRL